jgi:hypothetical protein
METTPEKQLPGTHPKWQGFQRLIVLPGLADAVALVGGIIYLYQARINALTRTSFLDEGLYLYKGLLFTSGQYRPFADFGPWTNQMPFAYLIPGLAQRIFGPGLNTGRAFSIFLALLMLLGLWIVTRRLAGRWWAAGVILILALNIATIKLYTLAISEVIVACLFAWTCVFILGEHKPSWQIVLGSLLATLIVLVRINMAPVMALVVLYVFWQHGRRKGLTALVTAGLAFVIVNAVFWPDILKIYAAWLPRSLTPWLSPWRLANTPEKWVTSAGLPDNLERLLYFFLSFRLHFLTLGGALVVWLLWPGSMKNWKTPSQFRTAVFLSVTLLLLLVMHLLAAFYLGFCISCVLLYITFFDFLGALLLAQSFSALKRRLPVWREILASVVLLGIGMGMAYSAYGEINFEQVRAIVRRGWMDWHLEKFILWKPLNAMGVSRNNVYQIRVALLGGELVLGILLLASLAILLLLYWRGSRRYGFSFILANLALIAALVFSPSVYLSKGNDFFECGGNVLQSYEATGRALRQEIPAGAKVFWVSRLPALLLYLPGIQIFPPQLNHFHNLRLGGEDQELYRLGLWNESLGRKWLSEADVALVEDQWLDGWVKDAISTSGLVEMPSPPLPEPCRENSRIHVYMNRAKAGAFPVSPGTQRRPGLSGQPNGRAGWAMSGKEYVAIDP